MVPIPKTETIGLSVTVGENSGEKMDIFVWNENLKPNAVSLNFIQFGFPKLHLFINFSILWDKFHFLQVLITLLWWELDVSMMVTMSLQSVDNALFFLMYATLLVLTMSKNKSWNKYYRFLSFNNLYLDWILTKKSATLLKKAEKKNRSRNSVGKQYFKNGKLFHNLILPENS